MLTIKAQWCTSIRWTWRDLQFLLVYGRKSGIYAFCMSAYDSWHRTNVIEENERIVHQGKQCRMVINVIRWYHKQPLKERFIMEKGGGKGEESGALVRNKRTIVITDSFLCIWIEGFTTYAFSMLAFLLQLITSVMKRWKDCPSERKQCRMVIDVIIDVINNLWKVLIMEKENKRRQIKDCKKTYH